MSLLSAVLALAASHQDLLIAVFLVSLRLAPTMLFTPLLQAFSVPPTVRVLLVVGLACGLALGIDVTRLPVASDFGAGSLIAAACTELMLGATLALGLAAVFGAVVMAGRLIDVQAGFGLAQVFDPATRRQVPILHAVFEKLGVLVFFLLNGHHALLRAMAYSLDRFPLGQPWPLEATAPWVVTQVGGLFGLGLALAAPVVVCLLLVDLALGVVSRNLPQMNMLVLGVPVKVVVALAALSLWMGGVGHTLNRTFGSIYRTWDGIFTTAPAPGLR